MKTNFEKTMKITNDLMLYCHNHGATEFNTNIIEEDNAITYVIHALPVEVTDEQLEGLKKRLGAPRQRDVEQDYWELMGESEDFTELTLVGMLCDEAHVAYNYKVITFTLKRYD